MPSIGPTVIAPASTAGAGGAGGAPLAVPLGAGGSGGAAGNSGDVACPRVELFGNGSFDEGEQGWSGGSAMWDQMIVDSANAGGGVTPQSGTHLARLGGYVQVGEEGLTGQDSLIRPSIMVPESATDIVFSFYSIVLTEEASATANDTLFMSLDTDVQYVMEFLDNTMAHSEWRRFEQPIEATAAGKTLAMVLRAENDASNPTTFYLDSLSLSANVCP